MLHEDWDPTTGEPAAGRTPHVRRSVGSIVGDLAQRWSPRLRAALGLGLLGFLSGVAAFVLNIGLLAIVGGFCALVAAVAAFTLNQEIELVSSETNRLNGLVHQLETALSNERERSAAAAETATEPDASPLIDPETGLLVETYFVHNLDTRIAAARRNLRPVSVVLMEVVTGAERGSAEPTDKVSVAAAIKKILRESDTQCLLDDGQYAFVLEDTPEQGAVWAVERIRREITANNPTRTIWAGIACYPAHAFTSDEIRSQASAALDAAKEWRQDRIEVAACEP